jgi:hypothetical protein
MTEFVVRSACAVAELELADRRSSCFRPRSGKPSWPRSTSPPNQAPRSIAC